MWSQVILRCGPHQIVQSLCPGGSNDIISNSELRGLCLLRIWACNLRLRITNSDCRMVINCSSLAFVMFLTFVLASLVGLCGFLFLLLFLILLAFLESIYLFYCFVGVAFDLLYAMSLPIRSWRVYRALCLHLAFLAHAGDYRLDRRSGFRRGTARIT